MQKVPNSAEAQVLSFVRQDERHKVFAVLNLSAEPRFVSFQPSLYHGTYTEYFSGESVVLDKSTRLSLEPWGYRVFVR
jgi:hypothetical protein